MCLMRGNRCHQAKGTSGAKPARGLSPSAARPFDRTSRLSYADYPVNSSPNPLASRRPRQTPGFLVVLTGLLWLFQAEVLAGAGGYLITQLAITNAAHPTINNQGEVVWAVQNGTGIYSSVRGQLSAAGVSPHLANSGEVVYADSFGGTGLDLVSTTRGRLTYGGIIELGFSDFNVNASGEVVYVAPDTNNN
jgi:hypothetical protein